ncbi:MAG: acyltransferase domain-containing protein, partial [Myxococcales bacterium]
VFIGELEQWLGVSLPAALLYDHPTVDRLAQHLEARGATPPKESFTRPDGAAHNEPIAIIGIGCRFPGADDPEAFWQLLLNGRDAISEVSPDRWKWEAFTDPDASAPGKLCSRFGGFLRRVDQFDPRAFDISPREAARMDPQQRLMLEVAYEALENAGLPPRLTAGSQTGVFVGISSYDFGRYLFRDRRAIDAYFGTGAAFSIAANRLSYQLDLHGPSLAVDSACSSSLVAVHLAMSSLWRGECEMAIAGGVNVILSLDVGIVFTKAGVLSPDGRCKAFDAKANGMIRSEGAGAVILKPLSRALQDGDHIWAVLLGGAVNSDGRSNGLMAPNGKAQEAALRRAYGTAGVAPSEVHYVEAHGTGTILGDPIEVGALAEVVAKDRPKDCPCRLGSVKSNLGHLEAAAGVAGLIKVALSLNRRTLPPSLHFETPNPHIPFDRLPIQVQTRAEPWPAAPGEGLSGVSSFGFGGTNAHVVLREPPVRAAQTRADRGAELITLSARSEAGLRTLAETYRRFLATDQAPSSLEAIAYSASVRRSHAAHRLGVVAKSPDELRERMDGFLNHQPHPQVAAGEAASEAHRRVVFVFPGQGGQWWGMGRQLLETEPVFRQAVERCDRLLKPFSDWSLLGELTANESVSRIHDTAITQPALFAVQMALSELWRSWGIEPAAVVGHSMGEITAAFVSGKLSLEDALRIIYHRGRVMRTARGTGAMAAVELTFEEAGKIVSDYPGKLSVAVNNAPGSCVIAGDPAIVRQVVELLTARDVFAREIRVDVAGHSPGMDPLRDDLRRAIGPVASGTARIPLVSTVTGAAAELALDAEYWVRNLREPVRFRAATEHLLTQGYRVFLEVGPHPVLQNAIAQTAAQAGKEVSILYSLRREGDERETMLSTAGTLYSLGLPVNFPQLHPAALPAVPLPTTPWDRQRYWVEIPEASGTDRGPELIHPFLARHTSSPIEPGVRSWEGEIDLRTLPLIADHRVQDHAVFPATAYLELVRAACANTFGDWRATLSGVQFHRALIIGESAPATVHTRLIPDEADARRMRFEVYSRPRDAHDAAWTHHASGIVHLDPLPTGSTEADLTAARTRCTEAVTPDAHYRSYMDRSIEYRGSFRSVRELCRRDGEALGTVVLPPESAEEARRFNVHPGLLDACLQVMGAALPAARPETRQTFMPVALERLTILRSPGMRTISHARLRPSASGEAEHYTADLLLTDDEGRVWGEAVGLKVQRLDSAALAEARLREWLYRVEWEPAEKSSAGAKEIAAGDGAWLIFADAQGFAERLIGLLNEKRRQVAVVRRGERFACHDDRNYTINASSTEDMERLFAALLKGGSSLSRVLYLWGLDAPEPDGLPTEAFLESQVAACGGLLHLVQTLARSEMKQPPLVWAVTHHAQTLPQDSSAPSVAQTALWGLGRSLAHEHPRLWGGLIDLDGIGDSAMLLAEMELPDNEDQLALRGAKRWAPRLVHHLPSGTGGSLACVADGAYLLTGGLGAIGLQLAAWLVQHGARHLVLTGRGGFAPRDKWESLAAEGDARAKALLDLEQAGATVHIARADAADEKAMRAVLKTPGLPPLRGVIHAAGVVGPKTAMELTFDDLRAEMLPKIAGGWVLHKLTEALSLDFFVCFSSASAIWGSKLLTSYGAANHFLDGLVQRRRASKLAALSVNWAMWGGSGMAMEGEHAQFLKRMGLAPMDPEHALEVLDRLIGSPDAQYTAAAVDWSILKSIYEQEPRRRLLLRLTAGSPTPETDDGGASDPTAAALLDTLRARSNPADRSAVLLDFVLGLAAQVLGLPAGGVAANRSLLAQGLDSLTANDLRGRLQKALPVKVNVLSLLKGDSPAQVADGLLAQLDTALIGATEASGGTERGGAALAPKAAHRPETEVLPEDIRPDRAQPARIGPPKAVLLTGTTGFLGAFTLAELCRRTEATVHCLVKADDTASVVTRLRRKLEEAELWNPEMERRIVPLAGDLAQPRLGLSPATWDSLALNIDQIYHVGFLVNFLFGYDDLRPTNVLGTLDLLRLASGGRVKPLHFVSSFSVLLTKEHAGRTLTENETLYPADGAYRETKRACERLIGEARRRGLPVNIYRPPFIGWNSASGYFNDRDFLIRLLSGCLLLKAAPELDVVFYIAPVDFVSAALVQLSLDPEAIGRNYNLLTEPQGVTWRELVEIFNQAGGGMELLPYSEWRERMSRAGTKNPLHIFFPMFGQNLRDSGSAVLELFHQNTAPARIDLSATHARLKIGGGLEKVTPQLAGAFIQRLKSNAKS